MLSAAKVAEYHDRGFVLGDRVVDDATLERLRSEIDRILSDTSTDGAQPLMKRNLATTDAPVWQVIDLWVASDAFRELLSNPKIVEGAAQLSGAQELRVWHDQLQYKPAGDGGVTGWHQDSPTWVPVEPKDAQVSAWVALDDAVPANGCMSMVPGSHRWGDHLEMLSGVEDFERLPAKIGDSDVCAEHRPVRAGHVHYHHPLTWHGSNSNRTERPRRAIALHYMTERTRFAGGQWAGIFTQLLSIESELGEPMRGPYFAKVFDRLGVHEVAPTDRFVSRDLR